MNKRWKMTGFVVLLFVMLFPFTVSGVGAQPPMSEVMEITWLIRVKSGEETTWFLQEVEKKFNVRIIPNGIGPNDREQVSVMLAAGEFPDVGNPWGLPYELYNEGVTRGIPEDMIKKHAPNYTAMLDKEYPEGWLMWRNKENKDEFIAIHGLTAANNAMGFQVAFRVDWAKNVGFELPNYEQKKVPLDDDGRNYFLDEEFTLDQLESLLVAFRDGDPDGNGKIDTIPWGGCKDFGWTWRPIAGAFGVAQNYNVMDNGKLYEWSIAPGYKEFLKLAAKWYKMGLIDKEFVSLDVVKSWEKIQKHLIGASNVCTDYAGADYATSRPPNVFATDEEVAEGAEVVLIAPPVGPTGKRGSPTWAPVTALSYTFLVNKKVDDTKLAKVLQILDYARFNGDESFIYAFKGKPGVHFDWQGEPWNSGAIMREDADIPAGYPKTGDLGNIYPPGYTKAKLKFVYPKEMYQWYFDYLLADKGQQVSIRPYRWDLFAETKIHDLNVKYGDTLKTIVDEFQLGVITGQIDIDADWDAYVAKWRKNGGDEIIAEYQKAPIVSELRKGKIVY